jgi:hypothetical protein
VSSSSNSWLVPGVESKNCPHAQTRRVSDVIVTCTESYTFLILALDLEDVSASSFSRHSALVNSHYTQRRRFKVQNHRYFDTKRKFSVSTRIYLPYTDSLDATMTISSGRRLFCCATLPLLYMVSIHTLYFLSLQKYKEYKHRSYRTLCL